VIQHLLENGPVVLNRLETLESLPVGALRNLALGLEDWKLKGWFAGMQLGSQAV
jgi:hypothetical protein